MLDSIQTKQILALTAQGASPEDIASGLSVPPAEVNATLVLAGKASERDIDDAQLLLLRRRAFELAMQPGDLKVSSSMTQFLIERDKPREVQTGAGNSITVINQAIQTGHEGFEKLKEKYAKNGEVPKVEAEIIS